MKTVGLAIGVPRVNMTPGAADPVLVQRTDAVDVLWARVFPKSTLFGTQVISGPPPQPVSWTRGLGFPGSVVVSAACPEYCWLMGGVSVKHTFAAAPASRVIGNAMGFGGVASSVFAIANDPPSSSKLEIPVTLMGMFERLETAVQAMAVE